MKVLFVWPNQGSFGTKPIGISLLSSLLKKNGHEVDLFDTSFIDLYGSNYNEDLTNYGYFKPVDWKCDVGKIKVPLIDAFNSKIKDFKPDLIAISVLSDEINIAMQIIAIARSFNIPICIGNKGAQDVLRMINEDRLTRPLTKLFIGEAIDNFVDSLNDIKDLPFVNAQGRYHKCLDDLPYLDWSLFDKRHFLKAYDGKVYRGGDHMIGWGCLNSCSYCINEYWRSIHGGMKGCMRRYSIDRIILELEILMDVWELDFYKFHDEDFLMKPIKYLRELSYEYSLHIDLPFTCMTNAKTVTVEKAELLANMGCVSVSIGIESGDDMLRQILNRNESREDIVEAVDILNNVGIRVSSFNMIGLPFDNELSIKSTIYFNRMINIKYPNISFYIPYRGTKLYDLSVLYGFHDPYNYELKTNKPTLKLPKITEDELIYYYKNFYKLVTED